MKKFGTRLLTAVVASSMIVTPVFAAPSVDDLKENKAAKESEVSSLQEQLTDIMSKLGDYKSGRRSERGSGKRAGTIRGHEEAYQIHVRRGRYDRA